MTKDEMVHLLKTDVGKWNRGRPDASKTKLDLSGTNFEGCDLRSARLSFTDMTGVRFGTADLSGANLSGASFANTQFRDATLREVTALATDFTGAHFDGSNLTGAELKGCNCDKADFRDTILSGAQFQWCDLLGTNFSGAVFHQTLLLDLDLSATTGLDDIRRGGPCTLGLDTIYRSQGKIPESFLREVGVPEEFIRYMPSLIGAQAGIQFYSCFISYSHKDEAFAERLFSRLRDAKLRVWYAPEEMKGGQKIHEQIETAIRMYDKLLLVISEASLQSDWVKTEIRNARRAERKTGKRKLFPVRLVDFEMIREWSEFDADSGKDLGVELREYFIPDFSEWKEHDQFEAAFTRLLRDLKAAT